jgi:LEA14-like dessication related protein
MLKSPLITVLFITFLVSSCANLIPNYQAPDLQLTHLQILPMQGLQQRFRLSFRVVNPNNIAFPIDGINFTLHIRDIKVATGVSNKAFILQPLSEDTFSVDVGANLINSGRVLLDMFNSKPKEIDYEINANIFTSQAFLGSIAVTRTGVIPLRKP